MALLSESEISQHLNQLVDWQQKGAEIKRVFEFKDFAGSIAFVNQVAELAESANHHPDIAIAWNRVTLTLSTHSQGGLTVSDFDLADKIGRLV